MPLVPLRDEVVVIDIEATCWEGGGVPQGQRNEIIEIGACLVNAESGEVRQPMSILVQPIISTLSPFCTQLTTITPQMLEAHAVPFVEACACLIETYQTPQRLWTSWGNYDRNLFISQCAQTGVAYPFSMAHVNLKKIFIRFTQQRNPMGLAAALAHLELEPVGTLHRGIDDAHNTARLLGMLIQRYGSGVLKKYWK